MDERVRAIVERLMEKTQGGELQWEPTSDRTRYMTDFHIGRIMIGTTLGLAHTLLLMNDRGDIVERVYERIGPANSGPLATLYAVIDRTHKRVDETLDSFLTELGEPPD